MSSVIPQFKTAKLENGVDLWYREAGNPNKPTFLLLHGFPTSSHQYRHLITLLAPHFHLIAPDLPGYGYTKAPEGFEYTFANLASTIDLFVGQIGLKKFAIYIFDYGAPVGLRLALKRPDQISGIVAQNGNAYVEGVDNPFWQPIKNYWNSGNIKDTKSVGILNGFIEDPKNVKDQYTVGFANPDGVEPTAYLLDEFLMSRPGQTKIQVELFYDYQFNLDLYPAFQEYFRKSKVPVLIAWGKNDYIFPEAGAHPYKKDANIISFKLYDTGHFALEDHANEIAGDIVEHFGPILKN